MKDYQGLALQEVYGMILMMKKLMRWSGAVWAVAEAAVARFSQLFLPPPPVFCITICKKALLLSAFAFTPSVFAADVIVATLSVENIQVRADWQVVGDDADHFRVEGGTLMLRPNISAAGKPDGVTITAIVEVRDKFSTLNPSYEDLTVRVTLTAVIMGCGADWYRNLAKSWSFKGTKEIIVQSGIVSVGDVIISDDSLSIHTVNYNRSRLGNLYFRTSPELYP
ncbi:MAG: hypothetical protein ACR2PV_08260, partial [Gammaproteobacteria bacterium]